MSEQFRLFGELTTVRIIRPDKEVPLDLRNHTSKHPELGTTTCVVVEFENTEAAQVMVKYKASCVMCMLSLRMLA